MLENAGANTSKILVVQRKPRVSALEAFPEPQLIFDGVDSYLPFCLKLKLNKDLTQMIMNGQCSHGSSAEHTAEAIQLGRGKGFNLQDRFLYRNNL